MNIQIIGTTDPLILKELAVINQGFFTTWTFNQDNPDFTVDFTKTTVVEKNDYLAYYFKSLTERFGTMQPWGLLNGMRPTKLVHSKKVKGGSDAQIRTDFKSRYLISDEKMDLLLDVANHQLKVVPDLYTLNKEVSIYIGIPFCPTRCAYCTFAAYATGPNKKWIEPFFDALLKEIELIGHFLEQQSINVTSVYLGGGTATTLEVPQLKLLLTHIFQRLTRRNALREITVEAGRPDTITEEKLALLKSFDVERISINPQTFHQRTLDKIGRHHTVEDVIDKYHMAKSYDIKNINMDLIVGLPDETPSDLTYSLNEIAKLQPASLTVHMLAYKRKSELSTSNGLYTVTPKEVLTQMGNMTYDFAKEHDYLPYYLYRQKNIAGNLENIGYSKLGFESVYNILMMEEAQNILGLGVGASSKFLIGESVHNPKDLKTYIDNYEAYAQKKIDLLKLTLSLDAQAFVYNPGIEI